MIRPILLKIASVVYRQRGESPTSSGASLWAKYAVFAALLTALGVFCAPLVTKTMSNWSTFHLEAPLPAIEWKYLEGGAESCGDVVLSSGRCPANPATPALWESRFRRGDPYKALHNPREPQRPHTQDSFWIGATVPREVLRKAAMARANTLVLGWINSPYRIWLDSRLMLEGDGAEATEPITFSLPMERLSDPRPLAIAVHVKVVAGMPLLDSLNEDRLGRDLGADGVGFATFGTLTSYLQLVGFWGKARPFGIALASLLMALLLFFFWLPTKTKPEYFYAMLFALSDSFYQILHFDILRFRNSESLNSRLDFILLAWLVVSGVLSGLAFARARRALFTVLAPLGLLAPILLGALIDDQLMERMKLFTIVYLPAIGRGSVTIVTILQIYYLLQKSKIGLSVPVRVRRLSMLVLGDLFAVAFYFFTFHDIAQAPQRLYWLGFDRMLFLLYFCAVALSDYSADGLLVQSTPVSDYHRRSSLPESVGGIVLVIDLKESERLFRLGARMGQSGYLVEMCLSHFWEAIVRAHGIVLQTEGDSLRAFFDGETFSNPASQALEATRQLEISLKALEQRFRSEGILGAQDRLRFRAGVAAGELKPVWHKIGGTRYASWAETGASNVLVESARYMELERQLATGASRGSVLMSEGLAAVIVRESPALAEGFPIRGVRLTGKHGATYLCAAYTPREEQDDGARLASAA